MESVAWSMLVSPWVTTRLNRKSLPPQSYSPSMGRLPIVGAVRIVRLMVASLLI